MDVVHTMNSEYGKRNLYGARSAYIARATPPNITLLAYCRKVEPHVYRPNNVRITQIALPLFYRARRSLLGSTLSSTAKRRASGRGFDAMTARNLLKLDRGSIKILHSWEWMPETYKTIRQRHPDAIIVREPQMFVEMSHELAQLRGIQNGERVRVQSSRGAVEATAIVTARFKPFKVGGGTVHQVGLPWHYGWIKPISGKEDSANLLTPSTGDANTRIPETKAFMVNVVKI